MFKFLIKTLKKLEGEVITIGIDDKFLSILKNNAKVNIYDINKYDNNMFSKTKKRKTSGGKTINIKKLSKYFKKKSIDYIVCDYEQIMYYYKYVFKDFVYLNNKKVYLYVKNEIDMDYIKKFKRYNSNIEIKQYTNYSVFIIDNSNSKTSKIRNICFYVIDTLTNIIDLISNILAG